MATINEDENAVLIDLESKTPKRRSEQEGSNDTQNEVEGGEGEPPPNKFARVKLNVKSNNTQALDLELAKYANKYIQKLASTQTVTVHILDKGPVSTKVIRENLLDPYLREVIWWHRINVFP